MPFKTTLINVFTNSIKCLEINYMCMYVCVISIVFINKCYFLSPTKISKGKNPMTIFSVICMVCRFLGFFSKHLLKKPKQHL